MIDDFQQPPERRPVRLDSPRDPEPDTNTDHEELPQPVEEARDKAGETPKVERPRPSFRTPEQAAALDNSSADDPAATPNSEEALLPAHATPSKTVTLFGRWTVSKKKLIIICVLAVLAFSSGAVYALTHHSAAPAKQATAAKKKAAAKPAPKPILSPLTGIPVTQAEHDEIVTGVMIENSPDARPQSGLKDAGVVYEAIAEAGITRFLALYQEAKPGNIGPVRSSRPYYLDWAVAFDASYAHVGGSPDALQRIKDINVKDLDQFFNPSAYHRITSRYAPHNVYTSRDQLIDLAKSKGYDKSSFTGFARKAEQPYKAPAPLPANASPTAKAKAAAAADKRTVANSIDFGISGAFYNAHYDYDAATNSYKRSEGGAPHIDADSNTQLSPKVVIALAMPYSLMADGYHSQYNTIGSGKMFVFQDGTVVTGTWSKGQPAEQFVFKDDAGKALALNPGQTWISVVGDPAAVTYR